MWADKLQHQLLLLLLQSGNKKEKLHHPPVSSFEIIFTILQDIAVKEMEQCSVHASLCDFNSGISDNRRTNWNKPPSVLFSLSLLLKIATRISCSRSVLPLPPYIQQLNINHNFALIPPRHERERERVPSIHVTASNLAHCCVVSLHQTQNSTGGNCNVTMTFHHQRHRVRDLSECKLLLW